MIAVQSAVEVLMEGNARYAAGEGCLADRCSAAHRQALVCGQRPLAAIIGCADSRVPPEIIFDQGLGDLFVIRVAGNIMTPGVIESVEYAVVHAEVPLVMVLGHSDCGAINATVDHLASGGEHHSPTIVGTLSAVVEPLLRNDPLQDRADLISRAVRANIIASVDQLCAGSALVSERVKTGAVEVMGAEYSLETGRVAFL